MKTLNEVIESITTQSGLEIRNVRKPERDRFWVDRDTYNDALHYLKEYRKLDSLDAVAFPEDDNPPLSWDELKAMEGKPVWIELLNHGMWDDPSHRVDLEWWVIGEVRKDDIILATYLDEMELCEDDLGVIWQAYRKERK